MNKARSLFVYCDRSRVHFSYTRPSNEAAMAVVAEAAVISVSVCAVRLVGAAGGFDQQEIQQT